MDTKDAGRRGGSSRSARKVAASRANIAKARSTVAAALAAFKAAQDGEEKAVALPALTTAVVAEEKTTHETKPEKAILFRPFLITPGGN